MKKIKFAAQVFILAASFPVLFITGISYSGKKDPKPANKHEEAPVTTKSVAKEELLSVNSLTAAGTFAYSLMTKN